MVAKYEQIRQEILERLRDGHWRLGEQLPALPVLAQELNATRWATERALNILISQGILTRNPKRGTFIRARPALEVVRTAPIALLRCSPEMVNDTYVGMILRPIYDAYPDNDWIFLRGGQIDDVARQLRALQCPTVLVAYITRELVPPLERLALSGVQVLCLGARVPSRRVHHIATDNALGIQQGLDYLTQLGHRRIAYLGYHPESFDFIERAHAFQRECARHGLRCADEFFHPALDHRTITETVSQLIHGWWSAPVRPTAIFSGGTELTVATLKALKALAIAVPDDVSLLGFDDIALGELLPVPLTVIRQPLREMGLLAAQALEHLARPTHPNVRHLCPPRLIVRASCAPPD